MSIYKFVLLLAMDLENGGILRSSFGTAGPDIKATGERSWAVYDDVVGAKLEKRSTVEAASAWHAMIHEYIKENKRRLQPGARVVGGLR